MDAVRAVKYIYQSFQQSNPKPASTEVISSVLESYTLLSKDCIPKLIVMLEANESAKSPFPVPLSLPITYGLFEVKYSYYIRI